MLDGWRNVLRWPGMLAVILVLAMLPTVLYTTGEAAGPAAEGGGSLRFDWNAGLKHVQTYAAGIASGDSFRFFSGTNEYDFREQIGGYVGISFGYLAAGALAGTAIGILLGIAFARAKRDGWTRAIEMVGALPDFIIILFLQFAVVQIAKETGVVVAKIANVSADRSPAVALPLASMIVIPALYMIRNVALHMRLTFAEDYIGTAKAKGLSKSYITFFHALPNVLPFLKADLHKFMSILMGNLFVVEYFYNVRGVTKLLHADAFAPSGYQFALVVNGLFTLMAMYAALYALLRLFILGWEKVFAR